MVGGGSGGGGEGERTSGISSIFSPLYHQKLELHYASSFLTLGSKGLRVPSSIWNKFGFILTF